MTQTHRTAMELPTELPSPVAPITSFQHSSRSTVVLGIAGVLGFVALWEAVSRLGVVDSTYLPPFSRVAVEVVELLGTGPFWSALGSTMSSWAIGLAISLVAGVVLGIAIGSSRFLRTWTSSTIEFLRPIPSVALIPIAIVVFSITPSATVFIVVWACFWVILVHVTSGVADVDPVGRATARSYGLSRWWQARFVTWPTTLPYLMTGVRMSGTIALVVAITIELVVGTPGLGNLLARNQSAGNVDTVYALALLTGFLGLALNTVMQAVERAVLSWHPSVRADVPA
ncbi:ABC transporter permease [Modestobacter versicolor]|uniref:ABC transporter permease n=1 Tax=Modestobacter versicolor TaxID=429133 RepID=UPI0034E0114B